MKRFLIIALTVVVLCSSLVVSASAMEERGASTWSASKFYDYNGYKHLDTYNIGDIREVPEYNTYLPEFPYLYLYHSGGVTYMMQTPVKFTLNK